MNRHTLLHSTGDLAVRRFDHPPHEGHEDPDREVADGYSIAFVRSGSFSIEAMGARRTLVAGSVLITHPGLEFTCTHGESCPNDVCLSIVFEPHAVSGVEETWARTGWAARVTPTPRLAGVQSRLAGAVRASDAFEVERWALAALSALEADGAQASPRGPYAVSRRDIEAVTAACLSVEADPVARRSVAERGRDVGLTSTRLTHAFRRYLGLSPHQYVVRWRLSLAAELLAEGGTVSESCFRSGFENLSHFCRTFQRALGTRPSAWKSLPPAESRRKVQDLLRPLP